MINQVSRNKKLLDTTRDFFQFVIEFFEPINASATHIYHSALALSPPSSIVQRLYYHQHHTPLPSVVVGSWDSWDQGIAIEGTGGEGSYDSYTWSPCGQFVATHAKEVDQGLQIVEIRDGLTLELLSTLTAPDDHPIPTYFRNTYSLAPVHHTLYSTLATPDPSLGDGSTGSPGGHSIPPLPSTSLPTPTIPNTYLIGGPTYSPDGCFLASVSCTSLIIWDIQTGGVSKEIKHSIGIDVSLVWSLDGGTIGTIFYDKSSGIWTVNTCDIASGTTPSSITLQSTDKPYLWAHNTSFHVMATGRDGQTLTINIFVVGSVLTKLESFQINLWTPTRWLRSSHQSPSYKIKSFSPTTCHISIDMGHSFVILDVQSSECLLMQDGQFSSGCFSADGSLFTAYWDRDNHIHIWKRSPAHYTFWRKFPLQEPYHHTSPLHFSPTMLSILGGFPDTNTLQVWRLDGPLPITPSNSPMLFAAPHCCATYVATCHKGKSIVTTINLLPQTHPHFIDTDMEIEMLALTGNVLLVVDSAAIVAWRLTEEGAVDGVFGNQRANYGNKIWTIPRSSYPLFSIEDQAVFIKQKQTIIHIYCMETGELLPAQTAPPSHGHWHFHHLDDLCQGRHHLHHHQPNEHGSHSEDNWPHLESAIPQGWVKDPEGKHWLWIPVKWRNLDYRVGWLHSTRTVRLGPHLTN